MKRCTLLVVMIFGLIPPLWADDTRVNIDGMSVQCEALNRMPVSFSEKAIKTKNATPINARFFPMFGYQIGYDPSYIKQLPPLAAVFSIYHECAHVALPIGLTAGDFAVEHEADCFALTEMKKAGFLKSLNQLKPFLIPLANKSLPHGFDTSRVNALQKCNVF